MKLEAYPINKILDVDHRDDIAKAEVFLRPLEGKKLVGVCRGNEYSPNCVDNDAAIMHAVKDNLELLGAEVEMYNEKDFYTKAETIDAALQRAADNGIIDSNEAIAEMTPAAFSRYFRTKTGKTVSDYIIDIRLGHAARQLVDSTNSVADIRYAFSEFAEYHIFDIFIQIIIFITPISYIIIYIINQHMSDVY